MGIPEGFADVRNSLTNGELAARFGVSIRTIGRWRKAVDEYVADSDPTAVQVELASMPDPDGPPCEECGGGMAHYPECSSVTSRSLVIPEEPARPTGLVVGGVEITDEDRALIEQVSDRERQIENLKSALAKAEKDLNYWSLRPGKVGERGMDNKAIKVATLREELRLAYLAQAEERKAADEASDRRNAARHAQDEALAAYVVAQFSDNPDILVVARHDASFDVYAVTGKVATDSATGEDYPVKRFGFEASVYGPEKNYYDLALPKLAQVSWPSIGAQSVADTELFIEVLRTAVAVAQLVNQLFGLEA